MRAPAGLTSRLSRRDRRRAAIIACRHARSSSILLHRHGQRLWLDQATIGVSGLALSVRPSLPAQIGDVADGGHRSWRVPAHDEQAWLAAGGRSPSGLGSACRVERRSGGVVKPSRAAARAVGSRVGRLARSDRVPSDGGVRGSGAGRFRGHTPLQVSLRETCERRSTGSGRNVRADRQRRPCG